jgi:hypothetical protein
MALEVDAKPSAAPTVSEQAPRGSVPRVPLRDGPLLQSGAPTVSDGRDRRVGDWLGTIARSAWLTHRPPAADKGTLDRDAELAPATRMALARLGNQLARAQYGDTVHTFSTRTGRFLWVIERDSRVDAAQVPALLRSGATVRVESGILREALTLRAIENARKPTDRIGWIDLHSLAELDAWLAGGAKIAKRRLF